MGTINIESRIRNVRIGGKTQAVNLYSERELKKFSPAILGLGDIREESKRVKVIAAIFDLEGFTDFCGQPDAGLCVPGFLREFLGWLIEAIVSEFTVEKYEVGTKLYSSLPFFAKFMGDGVLFLWDTENMNDVGICNILVALAKIHNAYSEVFLPKARRHLSLVPERLRCGMARGSVYSIGERGDYVGTCINLASRLQKLSKLGFCCSQKGINTGKGMLKGNVENLVTKRTPIRGVGSDERIIVRKWEYEKLSREDKGIFKEV